jgi:hypothetical protein
MWCSDVRPVNIRGLRDELRWALLCAEQEHQRDPCERNRVIWMGAAAAFWNEDKSGWWPPELDDCDCRFSPNIWLPPSPGRPNGTEIPKSGKFQVRPKGSDDDAWRDVPVDPLEQEPIGSGPHD